MSLYQFWVSQQTIPGNVVPDIVIGAATYIVGKYKVGPWIKERHQEHLDQKERHHDEEVACHKALFELHKKQHQELLDQHRELLEATRANNAPTAAHSTPANSEPTSVARVSTRVLGMYE